MPDLAVHDRTLYDHLGASLASGDLHRFVQEAWPIVEPDEPFCDNWHIVLDCRHLEALTKGVFWNLLINQPPATTKSLIVSVFWPCWVWTMMPSWRFVFASYQQSLSTSFSIKRRQVLDSEWYRDQWGDRVSFARDQNQKTEFQNTARGWMVATSVGGRLTGEHPNALVADDPNDVNKAESRLQRETVNRWWSGAVATRGITRQPRRVVMQQRVHENDLSGHILRTEPEKWVRLILPMRATPGSVPDTPLKYQDTRAEGELLWPDVLTEDVVRGLEASLGTVRASGQLQQAPVAAGGNLVKEEHFRYFHEEEHDGTTVYVLRDAEGNERRVYRQDCQHWFQTCDTALKEKEENHYTVVFTACLTPPPVCMLVQNVFRARLPVPRQFGMLEEQRARWPEVTIQAVEDKASGIGLIQEGRLRGTPFHVLKADASKTARGMPMVTAYENGMIYHKAGAAWLGDFEQELLSFPAGDHDDQWDAAAYGSLMMQRLAYGSMGQQESLTVWPLAKKEGQAEEDGGDGTPRPPGLAEQLTGRRPGEARRREDH